jgi:hypothetical protein
MDFFFETHSHYRTPAIPHMENYKPQITQINADFFLF